MPSPPHLAFLEMIKLLYDNRIPDDRCFRTLADNWYAYKNGHPFLRNNQVVWLNRKDLLSPANRPAVDAMHFVSEQARRVLEREQSDDLIKDHAVPIREIKRQIKAIVERAGRIEATELEDLLGRLYKFGILTAAENRLLKGELKAGMPADWDGVNPFSRYERVGIARYIPLHS
jgi:hypothetical protein